MTVNSGKLFFHRLRQNWFYQYNIVKTIADWIIILYILVPSIIASFIMYRSWWIELPQWVEVIPFSLLFILSFLLLFILGGHFRTFIRDADRIFLMKNRPLYIRLKQTTMLYSFATPILQTIMIGLLIAPFCLQIYQLKYGQLSLFLALYLSSNWFVMGVKGKLNVHVGGWRNALQTIPVFIGIGIIWFLFYNALQANQTLSMMGIILFNLVCSVLLIKERFTSVKTFDQDLAIEEFERNKYISLIFSISMDVEKPLKTSTPRKKPLLYAKSNRLFRKRTAKNAFLELFIKVTTRNIEYLLRYFQLIGITSIAMILIPVFWYRLAIFIFGVFFVRSWIKNIWDIVVGQHAFTIKYAQMDSYFQGRKIVTLVLSVIFILLIGIVVLSRIWIATFF